MDTYCPDRSIRNICQKFKILMGPLNLDPLTAP